MGSLRRISLVELSVTPVITASSAYTNVQQLGGVQTLDIGMGASGDSANLIDVTINDIDNQKSSIDIFFFNAIPTLTNADHGTFAMSAAEFLKCIGSLNVPAANYRSANAQGVGSLANIMQNFKAVKNSSKIYAVAVSRGTPTYTTTASLNFLYHFQQN